MIDGRRIQSGRCPVGRVDLFLLAAVGLDLLHNAQNRVDAVGLDAGGMAVADLRRRNGRNDGNGRNARAVTFLGEY